MPALGRRDDGRGNSPMLFVLGWALCKSRSVPTRPLTAKVQKTSTQKGRYKQSAAHRYAVFHVFRRQRVTTKTEKHNNHPPNGAKRRTREQSELGIQCQDASDRMPLPSLLYFGPAPQTADPSSPQHKCGSTKRVQNPAWEHMPNRQITDSGTRQIWPCGRRPSLS